MYKKAAIFILCFSALHGFSQTRKRNFRQREIGIFAGGSYYIGDINPRKHFIPSHPAAGIFFRYTTNYRYAFRFGFNYGMVSASDATSKEPNQLERNLSFRSRIYDVNAIAEFNFVDYRIGNDKHYFTMFLFAGIGGCYMNPQANINGSYVDLVTLRTEGEKKPYSRYQFVLPFGVGFKWNVGERCGLGVEWGPRKMFTDYLDDVSGSYPNSPYDGVGIPGTMRGNPRSKDWYFFYGLTVNFKLRQKEAACHGMSLGG